MREVTEVNICKEIIWVKEVSKAPLTELAKTKEDYIRIVRSIKFQIEVYFSIDDISISSRRGNLVLARQIAVTVARIRTNNRFPLAGIGKEIGGVMKHDGALHCIKRIKEKLWSKTPHCDYENIINILSYYNIDPLVIDRL